MGNDRQEPDKRGTDRVDLNRSIRLKFPKFQDFLTEIAGNVSPGGMFIKTASPRSAGEDFEFQCSLEDGFPLVGGRAEVVWAREEEVSPTEPAGMGVRFLELYENSRELIQKMVDERTSAGHSTFDLEREHAKEEERRESVAPAATSTSFEDEIFAATERLMEVPPEPGASQATSADLGEAPEPEPEPEPKPEPKTPPTPIVLKPLGATPEPKPKPTGPPPVPRVELPEPSRVEPLPAVLARPGESAPPLSRPDGSAPPASAVPPVAPVGPRARAGTTGVAVAAAAQRRPRLSLRRFLELGVISILVGAGTLLAFQLFWVRPRVEDLETKLGELTGQLPAQGSTGVALSGTSEEPGSTEDAPPNESDQGAQPLTEGAALPNAPSAAGEVAAAGFSIDVSETVQAWARAWSGRRVDEYLSFYSETFTPASGVSRVAWEARRRERLLNQGAIRVAVVSMAVEEVTPNETRVTFTQSYRSETFRDRVRKTLRMVREGDGWKIAEELVVRQLPW